MRFCLDNGHSVHDLVAQGLSQSGEIESLSTSPFPGWKCVMNHIVQSLQSRWFIPLEMRVISRKKEAFQTFSISKNVAWNALRFRFEEI